MRVPEALQSWSWSRQSFLELINLRADEGERTLLMFAFYTTTSMGILWLEVSSAALFLTEYGASSLPWIYVFSAGVGLSLSTIYSWLQRLLPLRRVIVLIALLMALPLMIFRWGIDVPWLLAATVFAMRLWIEAIYGLNDLNLSVTANQLFNIREIKRTYPIISSGNLVADVISGFSVYLLLNLVGLENVLLLACGIMVVGVGILYYLADKYEHAFPESLKRQTEEPDSYRTRQRLQGPIRYYVVLLLGFFVLAQILLYSIEFQFLNQLEMGLAAAEIASFLGIFSGALGLIELLTQWFTSSRLIEREGVFTVTLILPSMIVLIGAFTLFASHPLLLGSASFFAGMAVLKFFDEWLRYTLIASTRPVLFQPIPEHIRSKVQSLVGGIAEPLSMGGTGLAILFTIALCDRLGFTEIIQTRIFLIGIVVAALVWFGAIYLLRSRYLNLLVLSAERGLLSFSDANLRVLKKAFIDQLEAPGSEADKRSCIELLCHIDLKGIGEILVPRLEQLSPALQRQGLEAMLEYPNPDYQQPIAELMNASQQPEVKALALRYVWISRASPNIDALRPYLKPEVDSVLRGTAASLMMRRGNRQERAEATETLRKMLTHPEERERVMGCRALGEAEYMQALRIYIPTLLQDESLRVRRALLEAISATHLEEFYPSLIKALQYKSTREAAIEALTRLGNDALPMLEAIATDDYRPESLRNSAWQIIGKIGTPEALEVLTNNLVTSWGGTRRRILRILLTLFQEKGVKRSGVIDTVLDQLLGRSGLEDLVNAEIAFMGQMLAAKVDIPPGRFASQEADLLRESLNGLQADSIERCFMLLKFISPSSAIQAAQVSIQGSATSRARGIEILDNALDISSKRALLTVLDLIPDDEKLRRLVMVSNLVDYRPLAAGDRLRKLLDLRYFLSDWGLACCIHLARSQQWNLTVDHTLACLQHPTGFVREAVLSYLQVASPRTLRSVLMKMREDPDGLVAAQVEQLLSSRR